jgi:hypothetical protein
MDMVSEWIFAMSMAGVGGYLFYTSTAPRDIGTAICLIVGAMIWIAHAFIIERIEKMESAVLDELKSLRPASD